MLFSHLRYVLGRAVAQQLDAGFPPRRPEFAYGQHMGFVVDKAALGQVFSECFGFPCQHSTDFSIIIISRGWHNRPLSGCSVEWTLVPPPHYANLKNNLILRYVFQVVSFLLAFPSKSYIYSTSPHVCCMPCPFHPPRLDHSKEDRNTRTNFKSHVSTLYH
jgi:hypothetical protein